MPRRPRHERPERSSLFEKVGDALGEEIVGQILEAFPLAIVVIGVIVFAIVAVAWLME